MTASVYPEIAVDRTRWILERRGPRNAVSAVQPVNALLEEERMADGEIARVATLFLTNRECPWTCVMCDFWGNTSPVPPGSIPRQIREALPRCGGASLLKLYNSGSFFDAGAIAKSDWPEIASLCKRFRHVIVECHPRLVGEEALRFRDLLRPATLEVAMGLETSHPGALERLNKRVAVDDFARAAEFLRAHEILVRTFLLVGVPFVPREAQREWLEKSIEFSLACGSSVVSLIPTRTGNGALDALALTGDFSEPRLSEIEQAQEVGIQRNLGRVFADTWDLRRFADCEQCASARCERVHRMNLSQQIESRALCACGS